MLENDAFPGETVEVGSKRGLGPEEAHAVGAGGGGGDRAQVGFGYRGGERKTNANKDQTHAANELSDHDSKCRGCAAVDQNLRTASLDVHATPRTILCTCSSGFPVSW